MTRSAAAKPLKTATMISAAPVMMRPVEAIPCAIASSLSPVAVELLPDPAQQEDVVVHREAEEDREQKQRDPGLDRLDLLKAEKLVSDTLDEHEHQQAVGSGDGEQVRHDRLAATTSERNATVRSTKLSPSTNPITIGSQESIVSEMSTASALSPATRTSDPHAFKGGRDVLGRRRSTTAVASSP